MVTIRLTTWVNAPIERCFLLATNPEFAASQKANDHGTNHGSSGAPGLKVNDTTSWTLLERNGRLKKAAESTEWKSYVGSEAESKKLKVSDPPRMSNMQRFA